MEKLPEIDFDLSAQKYFFILPAEVCDNLLIDYQKNEGLKLCHAQRDKLETLRKSLLDLIIATAASHDQGLKLAKRRVSQALLILMSVVAVIFLKDLILTSIPGFKWLLYIGVPFIGVLSCIAIFINYSSLTQPANALSKNLGLLEVRQRINNEYLC